MLSHNGATETPLPQAFSDTVLQEPAQVQLVEVPDAGAAVAALRAAEPALLDRAECPAVVRSPWPQQNSRGPVNAPVSKACRQATSAQS